MKKVKLLDCTLRDGGYVNDWKFGHEAITGIYKRLVAAGVEYVEVGFLDERREFDSNRTINPTTKNFDHLFMGVSKGSTTPIAMIDYGTCNIDNISPCEESFIDGIRVIFKKEKISDALPFCKRIKEKGYKLFIQAISITDYSDLEMLEYIKKINEIKPYTFSIVDTYGLLDRRKLSGYFYALDRNLDPEIAIGYHGHNNFQLAFSNSISFLGFDTKRTLIVDSTTYGMGKSAGNCPSELISLHMNEKYGKNYDVNQFLEIFDTTLLPIYQEKYWGYKYSFYISAMHNCHPNYVQFLLNKKTLSVSALSNILSNIPKEHRLRYDEQLISNEYIKYQAIQINDSDAIASLKRELIGNTIVILGLGKSIGSQSDVVNSFIKANACKVISINSVIDNYKSNYIFVSNAKRYIQLDDNKYKDKESKMIRTSNINAVEHNTDYIVNYSSLLEMNEERNDNSLLLCLALLIRIGIGQVYLAGFDGFTIGGDDYYDNKYKYSGNEQYRVENNRLIAKGIQELSKSIKCEFLTDSEYTKVLV